MNGTDPKLDRTQKRIQDGQSRGNPPFQDGAQVSVTISDGATATVSHKLGRKPTGYMPMGTSGDGVGSLVLESSSDKSVTFRLHVPSGAAATSHTYSLWIF